MVELMTDCEKNRADHDFQVEKFEADLCLCDGDLNFFYETFKRQTDDSFGYIREQPAAEQSSRNSFGLFTGGGQSNSSNRQIPSKDVYDKAREEKWLHMLAEVGQNKFSDKKLKERCRKGIPDYLRGRAWPVISNARAMIPRQYASDCGAWVRELLKEPLAKEARSQIYKDISRTLPEHSFFVETDGPG